MAKPFDVELRLESRETRAVIVSVLLTPGEGGATLSGCELELQTSDAEPLGPRLVLPIAGVLTAPMRSTVQLRADSEIPRGSRVFATAWDPSDVLEFWIPADPRTALWTHLKAGNHPNFPSSGAQLADLTADEQAQLANHFQWIANLRRPQVLDAYQTDVADAFDGIVADLGLDAEAAQWLREIIDDEGPADAAED
jgi:hypothetical protein